jgi:hypothetical protein
MVNRETLLEALLDDDKKALPKNQDFQSVYIYIKVILPY